MNNIIEVENFTKNYGKYAAVDDVSFSVAEGSVFAFLGPNGAGKSTTINTLCTILQKTSGSLLINGKDVSSDEDTVRSLIGVVFQDSTLDNKMTVEENLAMHCHFYKVPKADVEERINFTLNLVDLIEWKKAMIGSLSGGMKRRVEIARSLLHMPKLLFLDEPTTGLDPQTRANIWEYILRLQRERNITIFLTTHYMDEAEICDMVAVMDKGKIIAYDTPDALKSKYTSDKARIKTSNHKGFETLLSLNNIDFNLTDDLYEIEVGDLQSFLELTSKIRNDITDIEIKKGTLNDVFLELTGKEIRQ